MPRCRTRSDRISALNPLAIRAITLDLDDTLWPVLPTLRHAEAVLADWLATHAPRAAALATPQWRRDQRAAILRDAPHRAHDLGFLRHESLRRALAASGHDGSLADPAFAAFLQARQRVTLYDDVVPVLERWSRRFRLVALSNGNADIDRIGLGRFFVARVSAHEAGCAKPDPRIFHEACRRAGVVPAHTLHVGDDLALDVVAARAAGLTALWLRRPDLSPPDAAAPGADEHAFADLAAIDARLGEAPPGESGPGDR